MTLTEAKKMAKQGGVVVGSDCGIWGTLEYVTADGWAGVRGPHRRLDEIQVSRLYVDPT